MSKRPNSSGGSTRGSGHKPARRSDISGSGRQSEPSGQLLWGVHPVFEFLKARPRQLEEIVIHQPKIGGRLREIVELAGRQKVTVRFMPTVDGERQPDAPENTQGVSARVKPFAILSFEELRFRIAQHQTGSVKSPPVVVAIDSIQDPHNLGAIIRTALAVGALAVILPKDRTAPLSGTVAKASAGALAYLDICRVTNLATTLKELKKDGMWVFGTIKDGPMSIYEADFSPAVCLVIGGEGKGLRPLVREQCDFLVSIPMQGGLDSLNASVATAVVLFEVVRQRRLGG